VTYSVTVTFDTLLAPHMSARTHTVVLTRDVVFVNTHKHAKTCICVQIQDEILTRKSFTFYSGSKTWVTIQEHPNPVATSLLYVA